MGASVKASVVLDDAYGLIGWDAEQLDDRDLADARRALSRAVQEVWEAWWWARLMVCERVQFAPSTGTTPYVAGTTYYDADEDWYFIALMEIYKAPMDGDEVDVESGWAKWEPDRAREAWEAKSYGTGDQVTHLGKVWQYRDPADKGGDSASTDVPGTAAGWLEVPEWWPTVPWDDSGTLTGPNGEVRGVSELDPRTTDNPGAYDLVETADGMRVLGLTVGRPWVWARRLTPVITGEAFDATETYEAVGEAEEVF